MFASHYTLLSEERSLSSRSGMRGILSADSRSKTSSDDTQMLMEVGDPEPVRWIPAILVRENMAPGSGEWREWRIAHWDPRVTL